MSTRLGGNRPWPVSGRRYDHDELAPRHIAQYRCPRGGHEFTVPFSAEGDVETPRDWECRRHGVPAALLNGYRGPEPDEGKPPRTHWTMLLERRSIAELDALLQERLAELAAGRTPRSTPRRAQIRKPRTAPNTRVTEQLRED